MAVDSRRKNEKEIIFLRIIGIVLAVGFLSLALPPTLGFPLAHTCLSLIVTVSVMWRIVVTVENGIPLPTWYVFALIGSVGLTVVSLLVFLTNLHHMQLAGQ